MDRTKDGLFVPIFAPFSICAWLYTHSGWVPNRYSFQSCICKLPLKKPVVDLSGTQLDHTLGFIRCHATRDRSRTRDRTGRPPCSRSLIFNFRQSLNGTQRVDVINSLCMFHARNIVLIIFHVSRLWWIPPFFGRSHLVDEVLPDWHTFLYKKHSSLNCFSADGNCPLHWCNIGRVSYDKFTLIVQIPSGHQIFLKTKRKFQHLVISPADQYPDTATCRHFSRRPISRYSDVSLSSSVALFALYDFLGRVSFSTLPTLFAHPDFKIKSTNCYRAISQVFTIKSNMIASFKPLNLLFLTLPWSSRRALHCKHMYVRTTVTFIQPWYKALRSQSSSATCWVDGGG